MLRRRDAQSPTLLPRCWVIDTSCENMIDLIQCDYAIDTWRVAMIGYIVVIEGDTQRDRTNYHCLLMVIITVCLQIRTCLLDQRQVFDAASQFTTLDLVDLHVVGWHIGLRWRAKGWNDKAFCRGPDR